MHVSCTAEAASQGARPYPVRGSQQDHSDLRRKPPSESFDLTGSLEIAPLLGDNLPLQENIPRQNQFTLSIICLAERDIDCGIGRIELKRMAQMLNGTVEILFGKQDPAERQPSKRIVSPGSDLRFEGLTDASWHTARSFSSQYALGSGKYRF